MLHTGQHYDPGLSEVFFDELGLDPPRYRLEAGSGTHAEQTARMLPGIETAVLAEQPDWVLVYGDTNSTLAGALAAAKVGVPVAHVEAGLRSFDRTMPEELNRIVVDRLSELLLCPTELAARNLAAEAVTEGVHVVGDVMLDANLRLAPLARERSHALAGCPGGARPLPAPHAPPAGEHRAGLARAYRDGAQQPRRSPSSSRRIRAPCGRCEAHGIELGPHVRILPPAGYLDFAALASQARLVLTDSGGVQKEAYWYGVPCVTLRTTTEWVETVETGWNRLTGDDPELIVRAVAEAGPGEEHPPLYGDGHAADRESLSCSVR